jgi:hypothetical protein
MTKTKTWRVVVGLVAGVLTTFGGLVASSPRAVAQEQPVDASDEGQTGETDGELVVEGSEIRSEDEGLETWFFDWFGYVRVAYDWTKDDEDVPYVGDNNGFVLRNARLGVTGGIPEHGFRFQLSIDGAADLRESVNTPLGDLDVKLRDAYLRFDPYFWMGYQAGQFKLPFSGEELRSTADLVFVSRAVGLEGVPVGRGYEEPGIVVGRQLGFMISTQDPIWLGDFGVSYYAAAANGNGLNQLLNDNSELAYVGRLELFYGDWVRLGGSVLFNDRTVGEPPDLFEENELGFSGDLLVRWEGLEVYGQLTQLTTEFPTIGAPNREQLAYHAQIMYRFDQLGVPFAPAYRFAYYHPWASGGEDGSSNLDKFQLTYHTFGLAVWSPDVPYSGIINYTLTVEDTARELDNDRLEVLLQVVY